MLSVQQRWADMMSDSDNSRTQVPPVPAQAVDDSYKGPPLSTCDDSNKGLNAEMKATFVAKETDKTVETNQSKAADIGKTNEPTDFSFLCNSNMTAANKKDYDEYDFTRAPSFQTATLNRPVTEFFPTLSADVILLNGFHKRKLSTSDESRPKRKRRTRRKTKADRDSESAKTEDASSTRDPPDDDVKKTVKGKNVTKSNSSEIFNAKSLEDCDHETVSDKKSAQMMKKEQGQDDVDWELRKQQRIKDVQKIQQTEAYARYCSRALITDPPEPDPASRLGKRVWKYHLERWRRVVMDIGNLQERDAASSSNSGAVARCG